MAFYRILSIAFVFLAFRLPAKGAPGGQPITTIQIAAAIRLAGMHATSDQVGLLSAVVAKGDNPTLKIDSIEAWRGNLSRVRLQCDKNECLPFVVTLRRDAIANREPQLVKLIKSSFAVSPLQKPEDQIVVRTGTRAVLVIDNGHLHIQLMVVCQQNGTIGQTIRVVGGEHQHTFMAQVCSDRLLRGKV